VSHPFKCSEWNYLDSPYSLPVHYKTNYLIPFDLITLKYCHRAELFTAQYFPSRLSRKRSVFLGCKMTFFQLIFLNNPRIPSNRLVPKPNFKTSRVLTDLSRCIIQQSRTILFPSYNIFNNFRISSFPIIINYWLYKPRTEIFLWM
jgi:hypothetical protein